MKKLLEDSSHSSLDISSRKLKDRSVRIFISSTFRDMQAERDALVRLVYPRLRVFCRERQVDFVEVDLRWGITEEQSEQGETIGICLDEIDKCRPYFIGILGERYGWIPKKLPQRIIETHHWISAEEGASITQLEIFHGVLNHTELATHSYFYFRNPQYSKRIPEQDRPDFESENPPSKLKLRMLKARIRECGSPIVGKYSNPIVLAERIYSDLCEAIEKDFPQQQVPDTLTRERNSHMAFAQNYAKIYIGREANLARLDAHLSVKKTYPLLVTGESGSGKSALLASWALHRAALFPEDFVFLHIIGSTPQSTDHLAMIRRLIEELRIHFNIDQPLPERPEEIHHALSDLLSIASQNKRTIILILDGLDRLEDSGNALLLNWLPEIFPKNVHVLLSTLHGPCMAAMEDRKHENLNISPLSVSERDRLITSYLGHFTKKLSNKLKQRIVDHPLSQNPLFSRTLLDELRRLGDHYKLEHSIDYYLEAQDIPALFDKVLERLENDYNNPKPGLVQETLAMILCARQGLAESELIELLGNPRRSMWSPLYVALCELTIRQNNVIAFANDYLRQAVALRYLADPGAENIIRERLAGYFEQRPDDSRSLEELPWLLSKLKSWPRLFGLLKQPDIFRQLWAKNRYEAKTYWAQIESQTPLRKVNAYSAILKDPSVYDSNTLKSIALLLMDTGSTEQSGRLWDHLIDYFQASTDKDGLQQTLGFRGNLFFLSGDLKAAAVIYRKRENLCRQSGNLKDLHRSLGNQGLIYFKQRKLKTAMIYFRKAEKICRQLDDLDGVQIALGNQGNILFASKNLDGALVKYIEQEKICRKMGLLSGLQTALGCQGVVHNNQGDGAKAIILLEKQEQICRQLGDLEGIQVCLGNQGVALSICGDIHASLQRHVAKADICRNIRNLPGLIVSLGNQGLILEQLGKPKAALARFEEQEELTRTLLMADSLAAALFNQAIILFALKRETPGRVKAQQALAIAMQHGYTALACQIRAILTPLQK